MSRARIVLVTPPYDRIAPGYEFVKHVANQSPSLGLLHLAAEVREHDYEPSIIESDVFGLDAGQVAERVIAEAPPYVGITLLVSVPCCRRERRGASTRGASARA